VSERRVYTKQVIVEHCCLCPNIKCAGFKDLGCDGLEEDKSCAACKIPEYCPLPGFEKAEGGKEKL
jgi:hypothetical protein